MSSNRLNNIFGNKSRLRREDISTYGETSDSTIRQRIEMDASNDPFDSDALEGWAEANYNTATMSKLDKKFKAGSNTYLYMFGIACLTVIILAGFYNVTNSTTENNLNEQPQPDELISGLNEDQLITLDESDLLIPEEIEQMKSAPKEKQIAVKEIKSNFEEKKNSNLPAQEIEVSSLPIVEVEVEEEKAPEIIREHSFGKEIYLSDLKLLDYRKYRSSPTVKTKQMVLTGTPANMENGDSEIDEPEWKTVQVPYIEFIDKTMRIFDKGQYKRALTRFETVLETYSDDVNANFYGGICLYNLSEYDKAIQLLQNCISSKYSNFDEEAQWMIALSYEKLGKNIEATKIFKTIVEQNGYYKSQAQKKLK